MSEDQKKKKITVGDFANSIKAPTSAVAKPLEQASPQEANKPNWLERNEDLAAALLPAVGGLLGYAAGGFELGAAGADEGLKGFQGYQKRKQEDREREEDRQDQQSLFEQALEKQKQEAETQARRDDKRFERDQILLEKKAKLEMEGDANLLKQKREMLQDQLKSKEKTESDKRQIELQIANLKKNEQTLKTGSSTPQGIRLNPDKVLKVQEGATIPNQLTMIDPILENKSLFDPIVGKARSYNPYDNEAQIAQAKIKSVAQSFGRYMEGGVLRKEDEEKYTKMFPNLGDTPAVARAKLDNIKELLAKKQNADVEALKKAGYDTSIFETIEDPSASQVTQAPLNKTIPSAKAAGQMTDDEVRQEYERLKAQGLVK